MDDILQSARTAEEGVIHCPSCGSLMVFDPESGGMKCDACGNKQKLDLDTGAGVYEELDLNAGAVKKASNNWGSGKISVKCKSCGAETVYDAFVKSQQCPFCGSAQVISQPLDTELIAPTHVIPFKISAKGAAAKFKEWIKGNFFAPKKCKESAKPENLKGVYLPFWTFDSDTSSDYTARRGEEYQVTVEDGDGKSHTETRVNWFPVSGNYKQFFDDVLISASKETDADIVQSIEPFDYKKLLAFKPEVLSGFLAERYTVNLKEGWGFAQNRIKDELDDRIVEDIKSKWRADRVDSLQFATNYTHCKFKHILLPLWISSFKYRDKTYHFLVNGQTGKVGGNSPVSVFKVIMLILIALAILWLLWNLI